MSEQLLIGVITQGSQTTNSLPIPITVSSATRQWTVEQMIAVWLNEMVSARTQHIYQTTLEGYRAVAHGAGFDLDAERQARLLTGAFDDRERDYQAEQAVATLATLAQGWAGQPRPDGKPVAANTYNQRLAVVSSFYVFVVRRKMMKCENPVSAIKRRSTQEYASATPLSADEVDRRMAAIDCETLAGKRDYALLAVALSTGRRLTELAGMRWEHLSLSGQHVTLVFPHAKGGKVMRDTLAAPVASALLAWLEMYYGEFDQWDDVPPDAPVWVSMAHNVKQLRPMTIDAIADVCMKRLSVSKVHTTRHTFAHEMEALGAKISEIQQRLGHSNIATTGRYLASLNQAHNPHGEALAARLGLKSRPRRNSAPIPRKAE